MIEKRQETLSDFRKELDKVIAGRSRVRPFVCNGSPLECEAFIVGCNPATEMSDNFSVFWQDETGFDKRLWFETYKKERASRPLKPGKSKRQIVSNTRRVIDWMVAAASPVKVLETNVFSRPTATSKELSPADREETEIFDFLLSEIGPTIILLHGEDAKRAVETVYGCALPKGTFGSPAVSKCNLGSREYDIITVPHLSRGCSQDAAQKIGKMLKPKF